MWYAYNRLAEDHQAALRAERDRLLLAEQIRGSHPGGMRAGLNALARLLGALRGARPQATGIPAIASTSAPRAGLE